MCWVGHFNVNVGGICAISAFCCYSRYRLISPRIISQLLNKPKNDWPKVGLFIDVYCIRSKFMLGVSVPFSAFCCYSRYRLISPRIINPTP